MRVTVRPSRDMDKVRESAKGKKKKTEEKYITEASDSCGHV